jgi:surface protein
MAILTAQAKLYTGIRCLCVDKNISAALSAVFSVGNKDIDFPTDVPVLDANGRDTIYPNIYNWRLRRAVCDMRAVPTISLTDERYRTYGGGNVSITVSDNGRVISVSQPSNTNKLYAGTFVDIIPTSSNAGATPPTFLVNIVEQTVSGNDVGVITLTITNAGKNNAQNDTLTFTPTKFYPGSPEGEFTCTISEISAPDTLLKTGGWTAVATVSCIFPTYIEIDIEKLGIPEGTTCTLNFDEGWFLEDRGRLLPSGAWEYPNATQGALSPEQPNYVTFRTPWYGVGRFSSAFSLPSRTALRIKQLAGSVNASSTMNAYAIYNPGRLAALFGGVFLTIPNAVKRVVTGSNMTAVFGPAVFNFPYRLKLFQSTFATATFTQPDTNGIRVRFASSTMTSSFAMNASPVKETDINLTAFGNGAMTTVAVKTARVVSGITAISSQTSSAQRTRDTFSTITAQSSLTWRGNYNAGLLKSNMVATTSLEQSFDFVLEVDTNNVVPITGGGNYIVDKTVLLYLYGFNGTVFWGDGSSNTYNSSAEDNGNAIHTYAVDGIYTIRVRGTLNHFGMVYKDRDPDNTGYTDRPRYDRFLGYGQSVGSSNTGGYRFAFTKVLAWGDTGLNNFERAFWGMENLTSIPGDLLEPITNLKEAFYVCKSLVFPSEISNWNVSAITSLESTFNGAVLFNRNINGWNVSNVTSMSGTFGGCAVFNQPLNSWNTANVTTLQSTFASCAAFNQNINSWNVSNVTSLQSTFANARVFNQPLNSWNTSKVITWGGEPSSPTAGTFAGAWAFNQPLYNWVIEAPGITAPANGFRLVGMFYDARAFNQDINSWNVSRVLRMDSMFEGALAFNQPLSNWDMTNVASIYRMFFSASAFNQDIGMWRTTNVNNPSFTSLGYASTFQNATSFNQDLSKWCVSYRSTLPPDFYTNTPAWNKTARVPVWGTCPSYP